MTTPAAFVSSPATTAAPWGAWLRAPMTPGRAALILAFAAALAALLLPLDHWAMTALGPYGGLSERLGGDPKRELEFVQQFGAVTSMVIIGIVILLQDPSQAKRVWDMALALALTGLACNALKMLLGRPRPRVIFHEHALEGHTSALQFTLPWQTFPLPRDLNPAPGFQPGYLDAHAWELWKNISSDLWSLPSSHAAAGACAAASLMRLYPRLTMLVAILGAIVGCARVILGAHYPSDVALGWGVGFVLGAAAMEGRWLSRRIAST